MKRNRDEIALNFLPLSKQHFFFRLYRKEAKGSEQNLSLSDTDIRKYSLPRNTAEGGSEYSKYLVSIDEKDGFIPVEISPNFNPYLAKFILYRFLQKKCEESLQPDEYIIEHKFRNTVSFVLSRDRIGCETIWLEPYYLYETKQLGFLLGYHFRVSPGQPFNKHILQRSLSLGTDGRENRNYYADHFRKLEVFLGIFSSRLFPLKIGDEIALGVVWPPQQVQVEQLDTKTYLFANGNKATSQFQGVKEHGPLEPLRKDSLICFMYRSEDKPFSYELYHALKGEKYATFQGMEPMFSFSLGKEHVAGLQINGYDTTSISRAIQQLLAVAKNRPILPLLLFPWSRLVPCPEGEDAYFRIKHQFLTQKIPTQFVSLHMMRARDGLKWSIANIGLAIFGKLGGKPWKLVPRNEKCLIIGIGQAHRKNDSGGITRYFAYSVLSDSSGLYDSIRILSKSDNKDQYLDGLTASIKSVLADLAERFDRFVIHTPFKLRRDEMDAVKCALDDFRKENENKKILVVLKFNEKSKYFGFALNNNSKVPFESSCVALGKKEYLVWFEGLQYHNPTIRRRISRPMHVEFAYSSKELSHTEEINYLQDSINLSGANWRGFNAKSLPVSIYYAKLIADYIGQFDRLGLPEIDIEDMSPWFL